MMAKRGLHRGGGIKKRISYDDLTLPHWVVVQLSNAMHALNRLSASQVALANSQTLSQQNKGRICKFYNEGAFNHE